MVVPHGATLTNRRGRKRWCSGPWETEAGEAGRGQTGKDLRAASRAWILFYRREWQSDFCLRQTLLPPVRLEVLPQKRNVRW